MVDLVSYTKVKMSQTLHLWSCCVLLVSNGMALGLVERTFLVQMAFWGLHSFGIVLLDIASGEKRPTDEVPCLYSFDSN